MISPATQAETVGVGIALVSAFRYHNRMIPIIEIFLGLSIGIAILWVTVLALVKFTRRVMSGEEWQDVLKDLWKKPSNAAPATKGSEDSRSNGQKRRGTL